MAKQQTFGDKTKKQSVEKIEFVPQLGKKAKLVPVRFIGISKKAGTNGYVFEDRIARLAEPEGGGDAIIV
ncbi:MAG: hypothetical protein JSS75_07005 [Bacteroidetes bacterium]|nr:hypothetical protein [Bacteroidota bacterium]